MNVMTDVHPYLDGKAKRMLIDGKWLEAASGKTFETRNPATGEILAHVAEGDAEDINRAVAAARAAFNGPWSKFKPAERQRLLLKLADLVEQRPRGIRRARHARHGRTDHSHARRQGSAPRACCASMPGMATALHGETIDNSLPGDIRVLHVEGAGRRRRCDHSLERPVGAVDLEDRPGPGNRLHRGPEARRGSAADAAAPGRTVPGSGRAARRRQCRAGLWRNRGRGAGGTPGRGQGGVHRLASHRPVDHPCVCRQFEACVAGTGRQVARHRVRRCRLDQAVPGSGMAVFANSGQICSAGTRLFVERKIYDEFVGRVAEFSKTLRVGDGRDPETQVGPLVSEEQLKRVTGYLGDRAAGGRATVVGRRASDRRSSGQGLFRAADRVRQRARRHAHRAGGDFRAGHLRHSVHRHRGSDRARQQR